MLKHAARVDDLALEIFRGRTASAIYILFENPSRESMCALGIRTCRESPAMLTKRSHMTALRVVAMRTQVLHTDETSATGHSCKIAAIEGYEEWGERPTMCELLWLRAMATRARATAASNRAIATTTTTLLSAEKRPYKFGYAVRREWGTMSAVTELESSKGKQTYATKRDRGPHDRSSRVNDGLRTSDSDSNADDD
ncbi:hypothetical protein M404DRAFT_21906 [Pisolithus tinctorius Marx 270]|uniref:Uncharacterized protein n=1 Tax=Pisolithus tinctorius Marx 270 TaxID=870435 RepID=A0A0C3JJS3_PISTI|nr:hypothetical protein M404DRAFT_21906 [Pisolithus tinctorius Marx 270]